MPTDYATAQAKVTLVVGAAASTTPTVTVTPSLTSLTTVQALKVTVVVSGGTGKPTPTGTVVLTTGSYTSATLTLNSGSAIIDIPAGSLALGSDTLTVNYTPDSTSWLTFTSAKSTSASVSVTQGTTTSGATTTLAVTSGGSTATSVSAGSVVTLTATVKSGSTAVTTGLVTFCDATAAFCTDIHLLGSAQLTSSGTAVFKFRPGIGSYSYKAVFVGTKTYGSGVSAASALKVSPATGSGYPTSTAIVQSGTVGNYTLAATVGGAGPAAPTGTVSFLDSTYGGALLKTAALTPNNSGLNWLSSLAPTGTSDSTAAAVADFNGDGIPDLAVTGYTNYGTSGSVTILLGNGDGTFTTKSTPAAGIDPISITVADFNGDGIPDLAVVNNNDGSGNGSVTILLGNGDGTFTQAANSPITVGNYPSSVVVGDFNGDGIPDLAVTNGNNSYNPPLGSVMILLGNGNGTFTQAASSPITVGYDPVSVAVGDFNGDGILDLAVANEQSSTVTILLGKGNGTFAQATNSPISTSEPNSVAVADFNEDGVPDLAVANLYQRIGYDFAWQRRWDVCSSPEQPSVGGRLFLFRSGGRLQRGRHSRFGCRE